MHVTLFWYTISDNILQIHSICHKLISHLQYHLRKDLMSQTGFTTGATVSIPRWWQVAAQRSCNAWQPSSSPWNVRCPGTVRWFFQPKTKTKIFSGKHVSFLKETCIKKQFQEHDAGLVERLYCAPYFDGRCWKQSCLSVCWILLVALVFVIFTAMRFFCYLPTCVPQGSCHCKMMLGQFLSQFAPIRLITCFFLRVSLESILLLTCFVCLIIRHMISY